MIKRKVSILSLLVLSPFVLIPLLVLADQAATGGEKTYEFQAEVSRLLNIIVNAIYTKKEIFLREVISNASDALDKIRYLSLTNPALLGQGDQAKLDIRIEADKENALLTITDRGIGMTRDDLVKNLGTIASSGTKGFLEALNQEGADLNLIGQFGVGFYSVYLVADKVTVTTKHNDDVQLIWESEAENSYTIREDSSGNSLGRGTQIRLHLKEDASEFLEEDRLTGLVQRYSEFITFPIYLKTSKTVEKEVPLEEPADEDTMETDKPKTQKVAEVTEEWVHVNNVAPIWTRSPNDVSQDEYQSFYKALTKEFDNSTAHIHFKAEGGDVNFRAILFVPGHAPSDLSAELNRVKSAIKLYVRRVFISDDVQDLLPRYLGFLRGLVDSDDLPLNVSREFLQQSKLIRAIRKKLVRKALEMLAALADRESGKSSSTDSEAEDADSDSQDNATPDASKPYSKFYRDFGVFMRIGVIEDTSNRNRLAKLLRYQTTITSGDDLISLDDYVSRMQPSQKDIYYIAGTNREDLLKSPLLEELRARNLEVLLMTDPVDEYMLQSYNEYEGHKLVDVSKENLRLSENQEETERELKAQFIGLTAWLQKVLGNERVSSVTISSRVRSSPCVLVSGSWGVTANMERIMKAQALNDPSNKAMKARRILEINPYHPVITELQKRAESPTQNEEDLALLLYETAAIQSGFSIEDASTFTSRIHRVINLGLSLQADATVTDAELETKRASVAEEVRRKAAQRQADESLNRDGSEDDDDDDADDGDDDFSLDDVDVHVPTKDEL